PDVTPRFAWFEHDRPPHAGEYARVFASRHRFGKQATRIAYDREIADRPQPHPHSATSELLRDEAQRRLERMATADGVAGRLQHYLRAVPLARLPEIAAAARALGLSERSLRRRLTAEGTSYRDAVRAALEASAGRMLRDPAHSIKQVAAALGFADDAAFHRAFKRWTGMTPGDYRRSGGQR
ncbi:MAG: helix-turn-helix domain-containing protein, partial [Polyangiaceae bacterium]